ncbi:DUF2207 domain-containing protein, partial [bacterium]|nr:DUF2207 domain-containing protein [bacterium]
MRRGVMVFFLALVFLATITHGPAGAKSYHISDVDIDITVRSDGSFEFREARTFDFNGDFTYAFFQVEKTSSSGDGVEITDIVVGENGVAYTLGSPRDLDAERPPGTCYVYYNYKSRYAYAKWFYRADDERRTFDISYTVHDAVVVHDDFAVLYWKFIGETWDIRTDRVTGRIHFPPGGDKDRLRAWLHANLTSEYTIEDERTVSFWVDNLRPGRFVELRILFPPELVPDATRRGRGPIWDTTLAEETILVDEANRRRVEAQEYVAGRAARARAGLVAAIIVSLLALGAWTVLFLKYGREHNVEFEGDYFRELPSDRPPAEVGYLFRSGVIGAGDMVATILDLAKGGYITITETIEEKHGPLNLLGGGKDYILEWVNKDV